MSRMPEATLAEPVLQLKQMLEALPSHDRLSTSDTEAVYASAYQLIAQGHFEAAYRYFSFLTLYRPTELRFLAGLALCHKVLGRYEAAIGVYAFMAGLEPEEPQHMLSMAECLLFHREAGEALNLVEIVLAFCDEQSITGRVRDRAQALRDLFVSSAGAAYA